MKASRVVLASLILLLGAGVLVAQRAEGTGERWDEDEVVTLQGEVTDVEEPLAEMTAGGERYVVHLGPSRYWRQQGYEIEKGDRVEATGQLSREGETFHVYLHSMKRDGRDYAFADDDGVPLWSGRHRGLGAKERGRGARFDDEEARPGRGPRAFVDDERGRGPGWAAGSCGRGHGCRRRHRPCGGRGCRA